MTAWGNADLTQVVDGQAPVYSRALGKFIPGAVGGGAAKIAYLFAAVAGPTYTAAAPVGSGIPGVAESWKLVCSSPSVIGGPAPTGVGLVIVEGNVGYTSASGLPAGVQLFLYSHDTGIVLPLPYVSGATSRQAFSAVLYQALFTPSTVTYSLVAVQPVGSTALGSGAFTPAITNAILAEIG